LPHNNNYEVEDTNSVIACPYITLNQSNCYNNNYKMRVKIKL